MYFAIQLWEPWKNDAADAITFFLIAGSIFTTAMRTWFIPERRKADAKK
jgi:hypothetical protein